MTDVGFKERFLVEIPFPRTMDGRGSGDNKCRSLMEEWGLHIASPFTARPEESAICPFSSMSQPYEGTREREKNKETEKTDDENIDIKDEVIIIELWRGRLRWRRLRRCRRRGGRCSRHVAQRGKNRIGNRKGVEAAWSRSLKELPLYRAASHATESLWKNNDEGFSKQWLIHCAAASQHCCSDSSQDAKLPTCVESTSTKELSQRDLQFQILSSPMIVASETRDAPARASSAKFSLTGTIAKFIRKVLDALTIRRTLRSGVEPRGRYPCLKNHQ